MFIDGKQSVMSGDNRRACERKKQREECGGWIIDKAKEEGKKKSLKCGSRQRRLKRLISSHFTDKWVQH